MILFSTWDTAMIIAMIVVYIVMTSMISIWLRSHTSERFMVAGRSMPTVVVAVSLMSEYIGAKSTIGTSQEAFSVGIAASQSVTSAATNFLLFGLFMVRHLYASGQFTISGFITKEYGNLAKPVVLAIMVYTLSLVNVGNHVSGVAAISTVMYINLLTMTLITATVSTIYFAWGDLKSVAYLTIVHSVVEVISVDIIVAMAQKLSGGIAPIARTMPEHYFTWKGTLSDGTIGAWVIGSAGVIFSVQFIVQAISFARSPKAAHSVLLMTAVLCVPISIALGLIDVIAKYLYPGTKSSYALPVFLQHMHSLLAGVVTTSLVVSIFASMCTTVFAIASLIVTDFYVPHYRPLTEQEMRMTRWISLTMGVLPLVFVLFVPQILALPFLTRTLRLLVSIVALIGIYLPFLNNSHGAVSGLILATIATTIWHLLGNPFGVDNIYIVFVAPALVLVVEKLLFHAAEPAQASAPAVNTKPNNTAY